MSETNNEKVSVKIEKPVQINDNVVFPQFPEPRDDDFDDEISEEEKQFYKSKFTDLNSVKLKKLHCSACDRHLGCSARNEGRMRAHPMLRTLVCQTCLTFYNSGEFEKGDDGSELYCRWCGQGGQVYCCSSCPHVFCAKCIKRNLGTPKIREIESAEDWKCFKCNPKCLWDLRSVCWALLRYCNLKNKITALTQDPVLKEAYQKDCALDSSTCCKNKGAKRKEKESTKKKESAKKEEDTKKTAAKIISKIPPTIQVKKFASIEETLKHENKTYKRSLSPKFKPIFIKNPSNINANSPQVINPVSLQPPAKKMKIANSPIDLLNQARIANERQATYSRIRPKLPMLTVPFTTPNPYNGFSNLAGSSNMNNMTNDTINLSLESLTQGLDMSAVTATAINPQDNDVVCTPDFPLEPLCEVTEDNDDDVQCITPGPVISKVNNPPPLISRSGKIIPDLSPNNIIQMTDNDVTVNDLTGGLKFRVDPQTLSSNKMYRLPDGRIFAINANSSMPGGYSATIVAVSESATKIAPKGATYAAKLSAISVPNTSTPSSTKTIRNPLNINTKRNIQSTPQSTKTSESRQCDLSVSVEWYRYNLIDAVDAAEYSLARLNRLKKDTTTMFLRTRSIDEMRSLHRTLERLLNTSANRFQEIRDNLNREVKQYLRKKKGEHVSEDDDDDVEILPDEEDDDPIYIDENSMDSNSNFNENQEVDLTGPGSSDHNLSGETRNEVSMIGDSETEIQRTVANNDDHSASPNSVKCVQEVTEPNITKTIVKNDKAEDKNVENVNGDKEKNRTDGFVEQLKSTETDVNGGKDDANIIDDGPDQQKNVPDCQKDLLTENTYNQTSCIKSQDTQLCEEKIKNETDLSDTNMQDSELGDKKIKDTDLSNKNAKDAELSDDQIKDTKLSDKNTMDNEISDEHIQDIDMSDEKIQDTEMSDELIEHLLNDDKNDQAENISNSGGTDVP